MDNKVSITTVIAIIGFIVCFLDDFNTSYEIKKNSTNVERSKYI